MASALISARVGVGMASGAGDPIANRTMSWVWLASNEVLESMTEPTRSVAREARGRIALGCMVTFRRWRTDAPSRVGSALDGQPSREVGQPLCASFGDQDRFGGLVAPAVHPHAEDDGESHARRDLRLVLGAQADGAFAPVRRVADA